MPTLAQYLIVQIFWLHMSQYGLVLNSNLAVGQLNILYLIPIICDAWHQLTCGHHSLVCWHLVEDCVSVVDAHIQFISQLAPMYISWKPEWRITRMENYQMFRPWRCRILVKDRRLIRPWQTLDPCYLHWAPPCRQDTFANDAAPDKRKRVGLVSHGVQYP